MKIILLIVALLFSFSAQAQFAGSRLTPPACFLMNGAAGFALKKVPETGHGHVTWWCPNDWGDWRLYRLVWVAGTPIVHPSARGADAEQVGGDYWRINVKQTCDSTIDVVLIDLCATAMRHAWTTLPLPPYVVRSNGSYATRPTYPVVNGVRSKSSNGSVLVKSADDGRPTACNPVQTIREGSSTYMQVKRTVNTVALCSPS